MSQKKDIQKINFFLASIPPRGKNWHAIDYFNFWAVSIQSVIGFSLIATLYLMYDLNSSVLILGSLLGGMLTFIFVNYIGSISQKSGLSFSMILKLSMGSYGANYVSLIRLIVGIFMFGVQTFFISKSLGYIFRILLYKINHTSLDHELFLSFFFGLNLIDWFSLILTLVFQFVLFSRGSNSLKSFINFSAIFVYIGLVVFLIIIVSENYRPLVNSLNLSLKFSNFTTKNNIIPIISLTGTFFTYFSILILTFGDFSRYAKNNDELSKGNFGIIINLFIFSIFALLITLGSDLIISKKGITLDHILTNPNDIIGKIDNNFLTIISLIFIIISSLSTNLIANYVPSQNILISLFPSISNLKTPALFMILSGLLISTFWLSVLSQNSILTFINTLTAFFGPIFAIIIADFYNVKKEKINHRDLFNNNSESEYFYNSGTNYKAIFSLLVGFIFSASTLWNESLSSFQSFSWIIGAFISYVVYLLLQE